MSVKVPRGAVPGGRRYTRLFGAVALAVTAAVAGGTVPALAASGTERDPVPGVVAPSVPVPALPRDQRGAAADGVGTGPYPQPVHTASGAARPSVPAAPRATPPATAGQDPAPAPPTAAGAARDGDAEPPAPDTADEETGDVADGPHSPRDRRPARPSVTRGKGFTAVEFDLGDLALPGGGGFHAPVRGQLVLPASGRDTRLVLMSHLRSGNCADGDLAEGGTFAYPCPAGSQEVRYDRGWRYAAEALAREGYTTLIPDLGPVWVGDQVEGAYDQVDAVLAVFGRQRDALARAVAHGGDTFGIPLRGRVDLRTAALVTHSRSGYAAEPMARRWASGPTRITSQYLLQPALETSAEDPYGPMSAPPADIPWLTVVSADDGDVGIAGNQYLSDHLGQRRTAPAGAVTLRGFGHNYMNRALSAVRADERTGCDRGCPGPARHEKLLVDTVTAWLDGTTGPGRRTGIAALDDIGAAVPRTFGEVPARWLIPGTPSARRETVVALPRAGTAPGKARVTWSATGDATARTCRYHHPMDPTRRSGTCADPAMGVVDSTTNLLQLRWKRNGALRVPLRLWHAPDGLALHLAPFGATGERSPGTPLRLTLRDTTGRTATVEVPASDPALTNVARGERSTGFQIGTVRVPLERFRGVDPARLDRLTIGGTGTAGGILLRRAEFTHAPVTGGPGDPPADTAAEAGGPAPQGGRTPDGATDARERAARAEDSPGVLSDTGGHTLSAALLSLALIAIGLTLLRHARARRGR
ncbi:hypothetical protein ABT354_06600 [Streptomyces sp. NPDC000594]|uniref:hypothetical protein n=1 Tax=Streptomyces sp. NPDC000594 TaxID=3154261 RepID=UPI003332E4B0